MRGDIVEIYPAYDDNCIRIDLFGSEIESIERFNSISGVVKGSVDSIAIFPAKHFITDKETILQVVNEIRDELTNRLEELRKNNK